MASAVFIAATFVSAFLLFLLEPMLARMVLPLYGGVPLVWTTMLAFFQTLLLLGYVYVFVMERLTTLRRRALLHVVFVAVPLVTLPLQLPQDAAPPPGAPAVLWLLRTLLVTVGPAFLLLSTTSPLLQQWFGALPHPRARDPYFLYIASNAGSLLALAAYPTLLESQLTLAQQAETWAVGYLLLIALLLACTTVLLTQAGRSQPAAAAPRSPLALGRRLRWLMLAWLPASLLGSITSYITTDLASIPLFWVLPLILYLASFILVFRTPPLWPRRAGPMLLAYVLPVVAMGMGKSHAPWMVGINILAYVFAVMFCHGELASDRPGVDRLTEYYVWMAAGGALGGMFNAVVAPALFDSIAEYPLTLLAVAFLALLTHQVPWRRAASVAAMALPICLACLILKQLGLAPLGLPLSIAAAGLAAWWLFRRATLPMALASAAILLTVTLLSPPDEDVLTAHRSFFGVYRVGAVAQGKFHYLLSGTTIHGMQDITPQGHTRPLTYYFPTGPGGQAMRALLPSRADSPVGVVGLGTGALACYALPQQTWDFYELDATVERLARDSSYFTFLQDCPGQHRVISGDARQSLQSAAPHRYGILVLDAYGSDAIPVHLLTRESMALYLDKLQDHGVLLFHVTNRHYDLPQIVGRLAQDAHLHAYLRDDAQVSEAEALQGKAPSRWMVAARSPADVQPLLRQGGWRAVESKPSDVLWTDDFSSVVAVLHF